MESRVYTYTSGDGDAVRVEAVMGFSWADLSFISAPFTPEVLKEAASSAGTRKGSGALVFFHIPKDEGIAPLSGEGGEIHCLQGRTARFLNSLVSEGKAWMKEGGIAFEDEALGRWAYALEAEGYLCVLPGVGDTLSFVPVAGTMGFLSSLKDAGAAAGSQPFLRESSDRDSPYDVHGLAYGLRIGNGNILSPPLFHREALAVFNDGALRIIRPELRDLKVTIGEDSFRDSEGAVFHFRPEERVTPPSSGTDLVIINRRLSAERDGGGTVIPMGGFVISLPYHYRTEAREVSYSGLEDIAFALQAGPVLIRDGKVEREITWPFYEGEGTPFPPASYPLKGRDARTGLGAMKDGSPALLWAEGKSDEGNTGRGMTLKEFAAAAKDLGLWNLIILDEGDYAGIAHYGKRKLRMAGAEQPVPSVIAIRG